MNASHNIQAATSFMKETVFAFGFFMNEALILNKTTKMS